MFHIASRRAKEERREKREKKRVRPERKKEREEMKTHSREGTKGNTSLSHVPSSVSHTHDEEREKIKPRRTRIFSVAVICRAGSRVSPPPRLIPWERMSAASSCCSDDRFEYHASGEEEKPFVEKEEAQCRDRGAETEEKDLPNQFANNEYLHAVYVHFNVRMKDYFGYFGLSPSK